MPKKLEMNLCEWILAGTAIISTIIAIISLRLVYKQLEQSSLTIQYENANNFNQIYDDWYARMPAELKTCPLKKTIKWDDLENDDKAWIRQYFNLYAQEYEYYIKQLIPKDMWEITIHGINNCRGAAMINLKEYPVLQEGYYKWKEKGAFGFPEEFTKVLDKKIEQCLSEIKESHKNCK